MCANGRQIDHLDRLFRGEPILQRGYVSTVLVHADHNTVIEAAPVSCGTGKMCGLTLSFRVSGTRGRCGHLAFFLLLQQGGLPQLQWAGWVQRHWAGWLQKWHRGWLEVRWWTNRAEWLAGWVQKWHRGWLEMLWCISRAEWLQTGHHGRLEAWWWFRWLQRAGNGWLQ